MRVVQSLLIFAATAAAGCYPTADVRTGPDTGDAERAAVSAVARLACPEREGDFRRLSVAADGRSCAYSAPNGGEVNLRLVALDAAGAAATLRPFERELQQAVPAPPRRPIARTPIAGGPNDVSINLPFFSVEAGEERARVRMPGVSVDADGENADVRVGGPGGETVLVNARDGSSEVRVQAGGGRELRSTYILAAEAPGPSGWRAAGYEARGPRSGPLVVALVRSRAESEQLFEDLDALVDRSFEQPAP